MRLSTWVTNSHNYHVVHYVLGEHLNNSIHLRAPAHNVEGSSAQVGHEFAALIEQLHLGRHVTRDHAETGSFIVPGHILHIAFLHQASWAV